MSLYSALDTSRSEIRMIRVKAGEHPSPVSCEILNVSLDDPQVAYRTVSYCWSDYSDRDVSIEVSGHNITITSNLFHALDRIRQPRQDVLIWVDSICINQADPIEKAQQVGMMDRIYSQCEECLVWLGILTQEPEACIDALDALEWMAGDRDEDSLWPDNWESAARGLKLFMKRPWWYRMWTVQEIVLPPKAQMMWGSLSIAWETVAKAADAVFGDHGPEIQFPNEFSDNGSGNDLTGIVRGLSFINSYEDPLYIVWRWRTRDATDPRDKFYGLRGLKNIRSSSLDSIPVDYTIDTATLYSRLTKALIHRNELLPLIGQRGESRHIQNLPSWALDLTQPRRPEVGSIADFFAHNTIQRDYEYNADKGLLSVLKVDSREDDLVLTLKGIYIDRVVIVETEEPSTGFGDGPAAVLRSWTEAYQGSNSDAGDARPAMQQWARVKSDRPDPRITRMPGWTKLIQEFQQRYLADQEDQELLENFKSLIVDDSGSDDDSTASDNNSTSTGNDSTSADSESDSKSSDHLSDGGNSDSQASEFLSDSDDDVDSMDSDDGNYLNEIVRNSLLFVTASGKLGFGPMNMRAGDHVWLLGGSRWRLVLRPAYDVAAEVPSSDCRDLEFKGECVMNGLMDGEGTRGRLDDQVTVRLH